jgi:NMD protein affecting ribosome stability and mRNA decay
MNTKGRAYKYRFCTTCQRCKKPGMWVVVDAGGHSTQLYCNQHATHKLRELHRMEEAVRWFQNRKREEAPCDEK